MVRPTTGSSKRGWTRRKGGIRTPAHFHAEYAEFEIAVDIESGRVTGRFPRRALNLVMEWYSLHKTELAADWNLAQTRQPLKAIDPLE